ncbi:MAG: CDP-glycerol glycerophosphotransferase family protein [Oscillospiraceae bacterium]|nr:CDP-glycerol glycerophosphotransferase family protein [Oscillospiraceae bacterium]
MLREILYRVFALCFCVNRIFPVKKNKVVLLAPHKSWGSLKNVGEALEARGGWRVIWIPAAEPARGLQGMIQFFTVQAHHLATARIIFLNDNFMPMAELCFSKKAKLIQLWHAEGALKKFGLSLALEPRLRRRVQRGAARYSAVVCSNERVIPHYAEAFGVDSARVLPLGSPRTDELPRPGSRAALRAEFDEAQPEYRGKRLILYAPTFRDDPMEDAALLSHFDFEAFERRFGEDAALFVRLHPQLHAAAVPEAYSQCGRRPPALGACDLLITDYSSLCLDAAAMDIPVILYAYDYENYARSRGFYKSPRELPPGPVATDFASLLDQLAAPDGYQQQRAAFAEYHLGKLDGRATERVLELIE